MDELTEEEKAIIEEHRRERASRIDRKTRTVHLLKVSYDFGKWLIETEAGATYSTFCDDFGYEAREDEQRPQLYEQVLRIIKLAREIA